MPVTAGSVLTQAAVHLNDPSQLVYTSGVLLPFLNMALQELAGELSVHEVAPLIREAIVIDVDAGDTVLPQMPADYHEAIAVFERTRDSSEEWKEVTEILHIPKTYSIQPHEKVIYWTPRAAFIHINPPSSDREVLLHYFKVVTEATNTSTALDVDQAKEYLALVTAKNAARDAGNSESKANSYINDINRSRDRLLRRLQKEVQGTLGVRRRPYVGRK